MEHAEETTDNMPGNVDALMNALGFAHAAILNDTAWEAVYEQITAEAADSPEDEKPSEPKALRAQVHLSVDLAMAATTQALMLQDAMAAIPAGEVPALEEAPADSDYYRQYL